MSSTRILRASILGALFYFIAPAYADIDCGPHTQPDWQTVHHVHDGDSLKLSDGRKIRLIGVNTPELARKNKPAEPFSDEARRFLKDEIKQAGDRVGLIYGKQRTDRYGRTLAHLFLPDGANVTRKLLREGLGSLVVISPNTTYNKCYQSAQQEARLGQINIWRKDLTSYIDVDRQKIPKTGFHHVRGTVTRVNNSSSNTWLHLGDALVIRISHHDLDYFKIAHPGPMKRIEGKRIEASGWVYTANNQYRLRVYHPSVIHVFE